MTTNPPLSSEERALLDDLNFRDAMARWQEAEDVRVARLAVFVHLDGLFDLPLIMTKLAAVETSTGDIEIKNRIGRLRTIFTVDMGALLDELTRLKEPTPLPTQGPAGEPDQVPE